MNTIDKRRSDVTNAAINAMAVTARLCKKYLKEDDENDILDEINDYVEQYCTIDMSYNSYTKALRETEEFYRSEENNIHIPFDTKFQQALKKENSPKRSAIAHHPIMIHYVRDICDEDEAEKETANQSVGEGGFVAANSFTPPIDPITKTAIKNPVRNKQCGHIYDSDSIRALILKKHTRCPYIGCPASQYIHITHLVVEENLKKKIDCYNAEHS